MPGPECPTTPADSGPQPPGQRSVGAVRRSSGDRVRPLLAVLLAVVLALGTGACAGGARGSSSGTAGSTAGAGAHTQAGSSAPSPPSPPSPSPPSPATPSDPGVEISAVGDVIMGATPVLPADDGRHLFDAVAEHLTGDVVLANLDQALTDIATSPKCGGGGSDCYAFRTPPAYAQVLRDRKS